MTDSLHDHDAHSQLPPADRTASPNGRAVPLSDAAPDPFDPAALRLSQDFAATVAVRKVLTTVPVRKPNKQEFVRVRPGEDWRLQTCALEDKINRDTYLVAPALWPELANEVYPVCLFLACNRQGDPFLWPVKLPGADGRTNTWNESALAAARHAERQWVRVAANMAAGVYDVYEARAELPEPAWPDLTFQQLLRLAFQDLLIDRYDHPMLQALRGER